MDPEQTGVFEWETHYDLIHAEAIRGMALGMNDLPQQPTGIPAPLGLIEPHAGLLSAPPNGQSLYKMMTVENLLRSVAGSYLHFNRVNSYQDLDPNDGAQLPGDQPGNAQATFARAPNFSAADYYNQSRARTYACCFSLENTDYIWRTYANGSARGKICVVFDFVRLRARLNQTLTQGNSALEYNGIRCHQIFSINYGVVDYVAWGEHRANAEHLPNPIKYAYLKSDKYRDDRELRISLSAIGMGHFVLNDGSEMGFPSSLHFGFDFRAALADGTITEFAPGPDCDKDFLRAELSKLRIVPVANEQK